MVAMVTGSPCDLKVRPECSLNSTNLQHFKHIRTNIKDENRSINRGVHSVILVQREPPSSKCDIHFLISIPIGLHDGCKVLVSWSQNGGLNKAECRTSFMIRVRKYALSSSQVPYVASGQSTKCSVRLYFM